MDSKSKLVFSFNCWRHVYIGTLFAVVLFSLVRPSTQYDYRDITALTSLLMNESVHNKHVLPLVNSSEPLQVTVDVYLRTILAFNPKELTLVTTLWFMQTWQDHRLKWNPAMHNGIITILLPRNQHWQPDVALFNPSDKWDGSYLNEQDNLVAANGLVIKVIPLMASSTCHADMEFFPFDQHTCILEFGSWVYPATQVYLRVIHDWEGLAMYLENQEWDLINFSIKETVVLDLSILILEIRLQRRVQQYIFNMLLPSMLFSVLAILHFLLPPQCGERLSVAISILLGMSVYVLVFTDLLPASQKTPWVVYPLSANTFLMVMAIAIDFIIIKIYHMQGPLPKFLNILFMFNRNKLYGCCNRLKHETTMPKNTNKIKPFVAFENDGEIEKERESVKTMHDFMSKGDRKKEKPVGCDEMPVDDGHSGSWQMVASRLDVLVSVLYTIASLAIWVLFFAKVSQRDDSSHEEHL